MTNKCQQKFKNIEIFLFKIERVRISLPLAIYSCSLLKMKFTKRTKANIGEKYYYSPTSKWNLNTTHNLFSYTHMRKNTALFKHFHELQTRVVQGRYNYNGIFKA